MTLRDKLKFWILLSNYIQMVVRGTSPLSLPDALDDKLLDLKAYGDCENRNLPEGYQELEYIEGNNNAQYINTGIVPTSSMSLYFKGQFVSVDASTPTQGAFLMGARDVSGQYGLFLQLASTNVTLDWFTVNSRWSSANTRVVGDVVEMKVSNSLAEIWVNGSSVGTHQYTPDDTTQYPLFLNALNNAGELFPIANVVNRIYRFTIDGICDMRPARRLSDGVLGMYDTIRKRFFTNAGTGTFIAGNVVALPEGYTKLEYIQGLDNTQYINTGIAPTTNLKIYAKFSLVSGSLNSWSPFGSRKTNGGDDGLIFFGGSASNTSASINWLDTVVSTNRWKPAIVSAFGDVYEYYLENSLAEVKVNGTSLGTHQFTPDATCDQPIYINGMNNAGSPMAQTSMTFRQYRFTIDGVADFVPARRDSDGAIGMFDVLNNQFYGNAGTGTFTAGSVVAPTPAQPLDIYCNNGAIKAIRPIKYLESTGTQYIDTGVVPNQDTRVELDGQYTTGYGVIFGVRTGGSTDVYTIQKLPDDNWKMGYNTDITSISGGDNNRHVWFKDKNKQYIDNVLVYTATYANFTAMGDAYLFGFNNNGTPTAVINGTTRVYSCKIWDGDTLIRDMIPALDANNIPCMFDKVEGKCYYNAGTGQFVAGYLPAEYEELEYIQGASNVQYINTGIIPNSSMSIYTKVQLVSDTQTTASFFFGGRTQSAGGTGVAGMWTPTELVFDWFGSSNADRYSVSATRTTGDVLEYTINNSLVTIKRNGTVAGTHQFTPIGTSTQPLYINGMNNGGTVVLNNSANARVYRFTVAGVCDMIPARKRSNGHIGMYDLVRRQFFENAGEGQFTFGKLPILPDGYTQLEYLESTETQYIDTGVVPNQDTSVELDGSIDGYGIFFGVRTTTTEGVSTIQGLSYGTWAMGYNNSSQAFGTKDSNRHVWFKDKNLQYMDGELKSTYTYANFTAMGNAYLFAYNNNGTVGYVINGRVRIYSCKIWATADSMLVRYMLPAKRNSDGVVGMYDIMNDVFLTNQGTGDFAYGAEIPDSRESYYYVDGLVEKVGTRSAGNKNLFNGVFEQGGLYQGNLVIADTRIRTPDYISFPAGTYTISCASAYEVWIEKNDTSSVNWYSSYTFTAASTDKFKIAVRSKTDPATTVIRPNDPVNVQVEAGSTATAYEPYLDGGKATCENLLGIGNTKDVQEILTGTVTRKFAVVVLDGSEVWVDLNNQHQMYQTPAPNTVQPSGPADIVSTHFVSSPEPMSSMPNHSAKFAGAGAFPDCGLLMFKETDFSGVSQWTAWLRQQYDAGTPVIVVYPLSADETELVAGQTLTVSAGNNTAEIIQASIDGLEIEAKYLKRM